MFLKSLSDAALRHVVPLAHKSMNTNRIWLVRASRNSHTSTGGGTASKQDKLSNRVAIITGSTDGIGFAVAKRMAEDGARVVISSRKQNNVDRAVKELKGLFPNQVAGIVCHVGKEDDQKKLVDYTLDQFGSIDILVSNVAVNPYFGTLMEMGEKEWDKIFEVNVRAPFLLTKKVVPHMLNNKRPSEKGAIVYVSSIAAYSGMSGLGAYSISKTALLGLCKNMSSELAQEGVRVNLVAPGVIKTKFSNVLWENEDDNEFFKSMTHMKRLGESNELGGIVSFLCSPDASYITGENFVVAGGFHCNL
jgi:dehydrogenase/reductase SDR family protein 4